MTGDFDAELHLRLVGERALLEPSWLDRGDSNTPILEIASALVAVSALTEVRAQAVVDDYELAMALRGRGHGRSFLQRRRSLPVTRQSLKAARVVLCERSFEEPWGKLHVHYAALGDRSTTVCITASSPTGQTPFVAMGPMGQLQQPSLTDDRGHTENAHFNLGGGTDGAFRGRLTTIQPLAQDTKWLDVGTSRVDLVGETKPPGVEIETLPDRDPAERYLWGRLSAGRHGPHLGNRPVAIDVAIDTLIAAKALVQDDPVIEEVRDVLAAFTGQQPQGVIREPWAGLLAGAGRQSGASGIIPLGAVTPPFDDTVISLEALMAINGEFELHLAMSPNSTEPRGPMSPSVTGPGIEWWAEDDIGNSYLGALGNWGWVDGIGEGTVTYWPALDPSANQVRIMPTGSRERAVITIDLPRWEERL